MNGSPSPPEIPSVSTQNPPSPNNSFDCLSSHIAFSTSVWFIALKVDNWETLNEPLRVNRNNSLPLRSLRVDGRMGKQAGLNRSRKKEILILVLCNTNLIFVFYSLEFFLNSTSLPKNKIARLFLKSVHPASGCNSVRITGKSANWVVFLFGVSPNRTNRL